MGYINVLYTVLVVFIDTTNMTDNQLIIVTDWEGVDADDFYLSDDWAKREGEDKVKAARELQKEGKLYVAYIVKAVDYAIYWQMDSGQVLIDDELNVIVNCESSVIGNNHKKRELYDV